MDQSLRNSIINIFNEEQNQMDGALDNQSDVKAPDTITEISVTQNSDGTWSKNEKTRKTDFFDGSVDKKNRDKINKKAEDLQAFCREIDNKMLDFNAQIDAKKQQLVSLTAQAKTGNCWVGTAHSLSVGGISKYFGTDIAFNGEVENIKIYPKMAGPQQDNNAKNVFEPDTIYPLTQEYTGYGYKNLPEKIVYKNKDGVGTGSSIDGSGSSLGAVKFDISKTQSDHNARSFSSVGVGTTSLWTWYYDGASSPATCVSIANSIDNIYNEIIALRKERDALRGDLNVIKDKKMEKELASWGLNRVASEVNERKTVHASVINSINKFSDNVTVNDKSLVLYLDAGDNDSYSGVGTSWYDLSGNGNHATLYPTGSPSTYEYSDGGFLTFNGIDEYAETVTKPTDLLGTGDWTIESWFRVNGAPSDTTAMNVIVDTNPTGSTANMLHVTYGNTHPSAGLSTNRVAYSSRPTSGTYTNLVGSEITNGLWYHGVVVRNGTTNTKLYLNGNLVNIVTGNVGTTGDTSVRIARWTDVTVFSNVSVSVVKIYTKAYTDEEVVDKYNVSKNRYGLIG